MNRGVGPVQLVVGVAAVRLVRGVAAVRLVVLAGMTALVAAGCLPQAATAEGRSIADLYTVFMAAAAIVAATVYGLATWAILRYRRRRRDVLPEQVRGSLLLEGIWTAIPTLTVLGLFLLTLATLSQVEGRARDGAAASAEPLSGPPGSITLDVTAFRWGWRFSFPDEGVTVSGATGEPVEVVLPVGRPVELRLTASDVNHAFYVPQFLFKRDAIPGRENRFTLHIEAAGTYRGQCAEFCGTYHSRMPFTIRAVAEAQFEAWLTERAGMASPETAP